MPDFYAASIPYLARQVLTYFLTDSVDKIVVKWGRARTSL